MKRILLSVLAAGLIAVAHAQVPGTLSYQGILVNSSGSPVADGTHYVQFRFYDDPVLSAGANLKYSSLGVGTGNDVATYKGMFTFLIGSGSTGNAAIPTNIWNSQLWVEVTADGAVLAPRIQLSSNAYAFKAQAANTMDAAGLTGTANLPNTVLDADLQDLADGSLTGSKIGTGINGANVTTGAVVIANGGTGSTTQAGARTNLGLGSISTLSAIGSTEITDLSIATADLAAGAVTGAKILDGTIDNADISASAAIADSKLATITTAGKVSGNAITSGTISGSLIGTGISATNVTTGTLPASVIPASVASGSGSGGQVGFWNGSNTLTGNAGFFWDNTNFRLGLGTIAPNRRLHLVGTGALDDDIVIEANAAASNAGAIRFVRSQGSFSTPTSALANDQLGSVTFAGYNGTAYTNSAEVFSNAETLFSTSASAYLGFSTASAGTLSEKMRISSLGNVGIGTSAPSDKLHIHSTTASAVRSRITNLTTGTSLTDGFSRELASDGLTSSLWNYENGPIHFGTNNINRATLSATGNLGIANTNPLYPLTVNNASNATSTYVANSFAGAGTQNGIVVDMSSATGTGTKYGLYNLVDGTSGSASQIYGYSSIMDPNGTGTAYGLSSVINGVGSGSRYGLYNSIAPVTANTSNHYGVYNSLSNGTGGSTGGYYGVFNVLNTTGAAVSLPSNYRVGTYNYVNESTSTALVAGTYNFMTNNGTGQLFGNYNYVNNNSSGTTYGIYADVNKAASQAGTLYGLNIVSDNDGTADSYLMYASSVGSTSGTEYGLFITGEDVNYFSNKVGMGTSSLVTIGTDRLYVNGTARSSAWNLISDSRFKTNVKQLSGALNKLKMLKGVSYNWRVDEFKDRGFNRETQIGFIAQEVEKVLPELVSTSTDGYKAMNYNGMTAVLVEGVNDQQKKIEELELVIEELKSKLSQYEGLSAQVEELKKMISGKSDEKSSGAVAVGSDKK